MRLSSFMACMQLLALGLIMLCVTACERAPERDGTSTRAMDENDVLADVRAAWVAAYNAADAATLAGYFADDAVMLPPNGPSLTGKAAIEDYLTQLLDGSTTILEIVSSDVLTQGNLAVERATYTATEGTSPDSPTRTGKYVMAFRRDSTGTWKIIWDIWNSNEPLPEQTP